MIVLLRVVLRLLADLAGLIALSVRARRAIEAENLVLRRQLALFRERGMKPRRDAREPGLAVAVVRLALLPGGRPSGNRAALAPSRKATILALQVAPGPSADSS